MWIQSITSTISHFLNGIAAMGLPLWDCRYGIVWSVA
nr:MAG TPA: hypothetical protein [Caudoviricetes sp.]